MEGQQESIENACWVDSNFAALFDDNPNDAMAAVLDLGSRWELLLPPDPPQPQFDGILKDLPASDVEMGMCAALSREWRVICKEAV